MCFSKTLNESNKENLIKKMSITGVEFTKEELKSLIEDEKSCVHKKRCEFSLALYPSHLENFNDSIKELLNQKKAKYVKELGGILLGYRKIKLLSSDGAIVNDSCYIHINIEADFYVFKPELGLTLKGIVNKISDNHLGCLVHRLFNISVPKLDEGEKWLGNYVDIGHEVVLNVTHIDLHSRLPYIRASLDETQFENTTAMKIRKNEINNEILNQNQDEITETPVVKKKSHKSHHKINLELEDSVDNKHKKNQNELKLDLDESIEQTKHKKKKHKKSKERDFETNYETHNNLIDIKRDIKIENEELEYKKHKKKHKKKDRELEEQNLDIVIKKEKKDKNRSLEIFEQKQIKQENNETIKKRHSLPNGLIKTEKPDISFHSPNTSMADLEDRKSKKKRTNSINNISNNISLEDLKLDLHDSDLEKILNDSSFSKKNKKKKKHKDIDESIDNSLSEEKSSKKRKRDEISDDDIVHKKHKKKKRHSLTEDN